MRTTLILQDELLETAKNRAANDGVSLSAAEGVVAGFLQRHLQQPPRAAAATAFRLPTFRPAGKTKQPDLLPDAMDELMHAEDDPNAALHAAEGSVPFRR